MFPEVTLGETLFWKKTFCRDTFWTLFFVNHATLAFGHEDRGAGMFKLSVV